MLVAEQYFSVYVYGISYLGEEFWYSLGVAMSPRVLGAGDLIFWFHSYDALQEDRASVHVGRGTQNDFNDAKIWL